MGGLFIDIFVEYIIRVLFRAIYLGRSRKWPIVKATVLNADCPKAGYGCTVATVYYEYVVNGKKYGDTFEKPFILHEGGKDYVAQLVKGMDYSGYRVNQEPGDSQRRKQVQCASFMVRVVRAQLAIHPYQGFGGVP